MIAAASSVEEEDEEELSRSEEIEAGIVSVKERNIQIMNCRIILKHFTNWSL